MSVSISRRGMLDEVFVCLGGVRPWIWGVGWGVGLVCAVGVVTGVLGLARLWVCEGLCVGWGGDGVDG